MQPEHGASMLDTARKEGAMKQKTIRELTELPENFVYPPLHPASVQLETLKLYEGTYALLSNSGAVDNSGFIVGERAVLVIDSHINGRMAQQIIDAVHRITEKPILYLVNTNYHGDHTFGNYMFPAETTILAHRRTAEQMLHFELEKQFLLPAVEGDADIYGDAALRLPDVVFERRLQVDLGGRSVDLRHFGPGNTAGDLVVYQPDARTAWTGNLIWGLPVPPMFDFGAATYMKTLANMRAALDVKTIVPGHGGLGDGSILTRYIRYASEMVDVVRAARNEGKTLQEVQEECPLCQDYLPPPQSPSAGFIPLLKGLHALNIQRTFEELAGPGSGSGRIHTG